MTVQESGQKGWFEVAKVHEVPVGGMKHVEANGKEILIANVEGQFYSTSDRCGHTNARLSSGSLKGNIVTCPLHAAQFDVVTGRKRTEPIVGGHIPDMDKLSSSFLKIIERSGKILAEIKTYDLPTYELKVEGDSIKIRFH